MGVYRRDRGSKRHWWVSYTVGSERHREPGGRTRKEAEAYLAEMNRQIDAGTWRPKKDRPRVANFAVFARHVVDQRVKRGVKTAAKDERTHVDRHLVPVFGSMPITEIGRFQVMRDGFAKLADKGLAPRTIRNVYSTFRAIQTEAVEEGVLFALPPPLSVLRGHLPRPKDSAGFNRAEAVFTRDELSQLLACEQVPDHRRVMYAVYAMTGARLGEVLPLRVEHFEGWREHLPGLLLPAEKTGRHGDQGWRLVPVHPTLHAWLRWWLDEGYAVHHLRPPRDGDLLFPTVSLRRRNAGAEHITGNELYKRWKYHDLPAADLRHRRIHDLRRTFVSVARSSRIDDRLVRSVTHRFVRDRVLEMYTTFEWAALCEAFGGIDWRLPGPPVSTAKVVSMNRRRAK